MPNWDSYPSTYRSIEVRAILSAVRAGDCVAVAGLSGSGKSNLLGFLARRVTENAPPWAMVDCNRLEQESIGAFFSLAQGAIDGHTAANASLEGLDRAVQSRLSAEAGRLCLLFDRFDALPDGLAPLIASNLRALRDAHKYDLTYVIAARRPPEPHSELAELFFAHTLWLGPLSAEDARWSARSYARRCGLKWDETTLEQLITISGGYPAWLRAACEAVAGGTDCNVEALRSHPGMQQRLEEFWADGPTPEMITLSRLKGIPLLSEPSSQPKPREQASLTAKEQLLLEYFQSHAGKVCEKDELIRAVWAEDRVFMKGVRDDSLAQLVRRLREKIETNPSAPQKVQTVPGRGYRFMG
jgi:hypothetical protein